MRIQRYIIISILAFALLTITGCSGAGGGGEGVKVNEAAKVIAGLRSSVTKENMADFDHTEKAMEYLEKIGTDFPNRCFDGSGKNNTHDAAAEWIVSELKNAGYSDDQIELQEFDPGWPTDCKGNNIILTVKGEDPSKQIIAGAHYDGDGAGDNGSGTALLLANAVEMRGLTPRYTVKYIFFDGEEDGLLGSSYNAEHMSEKEAAGTIYMINLDSLSFGDYCNIYGGYYGDGGVEIGEGQLEDPQATEGYEFAADTAETLGFKVMRTADLDGYYAKHGTGPAIEDDTLYTNPWTPDNPAPANNSVMSPSTLPASDYVYYADRGIEYIYFEATNWFAESGNDEVEGTSYTGYIETYDYSVGDHGMFMNTEHDTWENLNRIFPGRAEKHFRIYSPLLSALILAGEDS